MYSIIYIGADDFSAAVLAELHSQGRLDIAAVATYPDIPRGRGHRLVPTPVKAAALELGLRLVEIHDVNDPQIHKALASFDVPIAVLVSFKILPDEFLSVFPKGIINLHPSLLPDLRGAAPVHWAIMLGYQESGLTTFIISQKVDTGNILLQRGFSIGSEETSGDIFAGIARPGAELLLESVTGYLSGEIVPVLQQDEPGHRAPRIQGKHRPVRWEWDAQKVHNRIRGLSPSPGAIAVLNGKTIKLLRSRLAESETKGSPGTIVDATMEEIIVQTGNGTVALIELQPEGKQIMSARDFARGYIRGEGLKFE